MVVVMKNACNDLYYVMEVKESGFRNVGKLEKTSHLPLHGSLIGHGLPGLDGGVVEVEGHGGRDEKRSQ